MLASLVRAFDMSFYVTLKSGLCSRTLIPTATQRLNTKRWDQAFAGDMQSLVVSIRTTRRFPCKITCTDWLILVLVAR